MLFWDVLERVEILVLCSRGRRVALRVLSKDTRIVPCQGREGKGEMS